MSLSSLFINYMFKKNDDKRDKGLKTPNDIERVDNISYGIHKKWNLLDIYYPKGTTEKLPTIINIHGGGWVYGTKETYQYYCMSLANKGFTVINFNYRLAPKFKFPSQLKDINDVVNWTIDNSDEYPIDSNNIFFVGDSAGAHLGSLYTSLCISEDYRKNYDFTLPNDFVPNALLFNCGMYHFLVDDINKSKLFASMIKDLTGKSNFKEILKLITPTNYINENYPPTFLMSATGDMLLGHVEIMEKALIEHGIDTTVKIYGDDTNKPPHVFHCDIKSNLANECNNEQCDYLRRYIK